MKITQEIKAKRYEPLSVGDVVHVTRAIKAYEPLQKEHGDFLGEFALRVSLQLQNYPRAIELQKREIERNTKSVSDVLREIADFLEEWHLAPRGLATSRATCAVY